MNPWLALVFIPRRQHSPKPFLQAFYLHCVNLYVTSSGITGSLTRCNYFYSHSKAFLVCSISGCESITQRMRYMEYQCGLCTANTELRNVDISVHIKQAPFLITHWFLKETRNHSSWAVKQWIEDNVSESILPERELWMSTSSPATRSTLR